MCNREWKENATTQWFVFLPNGERTIKKTLPKDVQSSRSSNWPTQRKCMGSDRSRPISSRVSRAAVSWSSSCSSCLPPGSATCPDHRSVLRVARSIKRISGVPERTQGCPKNSSRLSGCSMAWTGCERLEEDRVRSGRTLMMMATEALLYLGGWEDTFRGGPSESIMEVRALSSLVMM